MLHKNFRNHFMIVVIALTLAILMVACGGQTAAPTVEPTMAPTAEPTMAPTVAPTAVPTEVPTAEPMMIEDEPSADMMMQEDLMLDGSAAGLRVVLNRLLGEHVLLAGSATGAALDGRDADFAAAAESLDINSQSLATAIGAVYGDAAGAAFLELWRTHIGFFVNYTLGVAGNDDAAKQAALDDLDGYGADFSAFLAGANPNIDPAAIEANLAEHVSTLTAAIDAQGAGDPVAAYSALRSAYGHMAMTAQALSVAIATQFPDVFPGEAVSPAADLRVALNNLLGEHAFLAAMATDAALGGRNAEFEAAAGALDNNSKDLAAAITSVYGEAAGAAFLELWRSHIGFFVNYTLAVAAGDDAATEAARADLIGYGPDFGAFLASANPNLTQDAVASLLVPHVGTLTGTIDAQANDQPRTAYAFLRDAYTHMQMVADPLAGAIIAQFPDDFPAMAAGEMDGMDHDMGDMGDMGDGAITSATGAANLRTALTNLLGEHVLLAATATGSALDGRNADFEAAAGALDANSVALSGAIGSVYGEDAGSAFLELWRTHIGFFVNYTLGVAGNDEAAKQGALDDLAGYGADFSAFLAGANPNIDPAAVEANLAEHVSTLTAVIDAQAAGDHEMAYTTLRMAYGHMQMTAAVLADAIAMQFPEQFDGSAVTPAADLRTALNVLLSEHVYVAALATDAALNGREAEFNAAAAALDLNSQDLAAAIESVYGQAAGAAFLELWRTHIGFFVNYTLGVAANDDAATQAALDDLDGYGVDFGAFLAGANPNLTQEAIESLLAPHVTTLTVVIDAQAEDSPEAYTLLREAYGHMQMVADPLSEAIIQQFPDTFR